jgi:hypothetical protein
LVRSPDKAKACETSGIMPVHGTLADHELVAEEASAADVVVNAASSDNRPAMDVLPRAQSGLGKTLLHTSGSSIVQPCAQHLSSAEP